MWNLLRWRVSLSNTRERGMRWKKEGGHDEKKESNRVRIRAKGRVIASVCLGIATAFFVFDMKKVLLTLSLMVLTGSLLAQESPTTPRAARIQISEGPEVPLVGG